MGGWWGQRRRRIWRERRTHYGRKNVFWKKRHRLVVWKRKEANIKRKKKLTAGGGCMKEDNSSREGKRESILEEGSRGCCFGMREREVLIAWESAIWGEERKVRKEEHCEFLTEERERLFWNGDTWLFVDSPEIHPRSGRRVETDLAESWRSSSRNIQKGCLKG